MREDIALALDGSAILLVALGFWFAFQRRSWAGVLFGVVGLMVMSGSAALRAYPSPTRAALQQTVDSLRADLVVVTEKWRQADGKADELERKFRKAEETGQEIEKKLAAEVEAKLVLTKTADTLRGELGEARRKADEARRATDKVRLDALTRLKGIIAARLSTKYYQIAILPEPELVAGKSGTYLSIRLKDQATAAQFIFPKGRYTIPASEEAILNAADRLANDILRTLDGVVDYQVLIRGGADTERFVGIGEVPAELSSIAYRARADGGKYATGLSEQAFRAPLSNEHLPMLRAAYFRSLIRERLAAHQLDILHNVPSPGGDEERTVELILYVNW